MQLLRTVDPVGVNLRAKKRFRRRVYHSKASSILFDNSRGHAGYECL